MMSFHDPSLSDRRLSQDEISAARSLLTQSGQVALLHFEGRFVLVGRAYDPKVAEVINQIKGRSVGRPLVMCFHDPKKLEQAYLSSPLLSLLTQFYDRVTVSIPSPPNLPSAAHSGVGMIGARLIHSEPLAGLLVAMDEPLLISSANPTGRPSARHLEDLDSYGLSHLPLVGAEPPEDQPSILRRATVVGLANSELIVLSPGDTSLNEVKRSWEELKLSGEALG